MTKDVRLPVQYLLSHLICEFRCSAHGQLCVWGSRWRLGVSHIPCVLPGVRHGPVCHCRLWAAWTPTRAGTVPRCACSVLAKRSLRTCPTW